MSTSFVPCDALAAPRQAIENGLQERLSSASDYWRQVLVISKNSPRAMVQVGVARRAVVCEAGFAGWVTWSWYP